MQRAALPSRVTELLGIELPIVSGPMGGVAGPELVGAVSEAGGLGLLGHANVAPDQVRAEIRQTKALTARPFGIGLLFPSRRDTPAPAPAPLPDFLQRFVGPDGLADVPASSYSHEMAEERLEIAIAEGVKVLSLGLGAPGHIVDRAKSAGMKVIALTGSLRAALEVEALGVDAIVAQGHEAGGHTGRVSTMVLVPQVADAVKVPLLAAGGIMDGRGLAAALMLGADGVLIGTRLIATPEARTHQNHKNGIVEMREDNTLVSRCYTGKPSRVIRNAFTDAWKGHDAEILDMPAQWERVAPVVIPAKRSGSLDVANWPTGQGAVLVGTIMPAQEVIRTMAEEALDVLAKPQRDIKTS